LYFYMLAAIEVGRSGGGCEMTLRVGDRLRSPISNVVVIVVRCAAASATLACGGVAMSAAMSMPAGMPAGSGPAGREEVLLGKRYESTDGRLEVLCVRGGHGGLTVDGAELLVKRSRQLPSSD
jgi:hypothetical protein